MMRSSNRASYLFAFHLAKGPRPEEDIVEGSRGVYTEREGKVFNAEGIGIRD